MERFKVGGAIAEQNNFVELDERVRAQFATLSTQLAKEMEFLRDMTAHDRVAAMRMEKAILRLTVMVDVLFRALAAKEGIDMSQAKRWMEEETSALEAPDPKAAYR